MKNFENCFFMNVAILGNIGPCKKNEKNGIFLEKTWIAFSDVSSPYAQMSLIVGLLKAKTKVINMICDVNLKSL